MRLTDLLRTNSFRTGLLFMGLFGTGSMVLFGTIYVETGVYLNRQSEVWLRREMKGRVRSSPADRIEHLNARALTDFGEQRPFALFAADGRILAGRMGAAPHPPAFDVPFIFQTITSSGQPITYRTLAHRLDNGQMLVVAQDVDEADDFSELIVHAVLMGGAFMLTLGLGGAIVLGRSTARHIDAMRLAIERIVTGHLSERLPIGGGNSDLERLARVVNTMLDELERMVGEVKSVCDNIAHDMRTPLARLLAGLERAQRRNGDSAALRDSIETAVNETKQILRIFAALLRISEIEDGVRRAGFESVDLVTIATDAFDYHQPAAEVRGIRLSYDAPAQLPIEGDADLLFEALTNLLDNAIKFAGENGYIELSIAAGPLIRVSDKGPGIPVNEREAVMRRFERGEASRNHPGSGLGLPLVAAIARLHGLTIEIGDEMPGCTVTLRPAGLEQGVRRKQAVPSSSHPF